jgi:hypothetical protein
LRPAADAFFEVGVLVGVMLAAFGLLQAATGGRIEGALVRHRRLGPVAGALLGVVPGCGGAILLVPLYRRGTVSFGTIVAALVATMGDSSFVLIAAAPGTAAVVHLVLLGTGLVTGALVDLLRLAPPPSPLSVRPLREQVASTVGAAAAVPNITGRGVFVRRPSPTLLSFWSLIAVGAVVSVPLLAQATDPAALARMSGGLDLHLLLGATGAAVMVAVTVLSRGHAHVCAVPGSSRVALRDAARETAQVTTWVVVAFVVFEALTLVPALHPSALPLAGLTGVVAGAMVGLVPSCGPQIVLTGLYTQGVLPVSVLIANALSQDGDALLPLLATDRRAAAIAAGVTTVPGVLVGWALLAAVS